MSAQSKLNEINELQARLEAERKVFKEKTLAIFKEALMAPFEVYPELAAYRWSQYTPYFNDGEPCVFRVYENGIKLKTEIIKDADKWSEVCYGIKEDEDEIPGWSPWTFANNNPEFAEAKGLIETLLNKKEILPELFGDGYLVTVSHTGQIEVQEIDHD